MLGSQLFRVIKVTGDEVVRVGRQASVQRYDFDCYAVVASFLSLFFPFDRRALWGPGPDCIL